MTMLDFTLHRKQTGDGSQIAFEVSAAIHNTLWSYIKTVGSKTGEYFRVRIDRPFKPRSTGEWSQNHHLRGHEQQLASAMGLTMSEIHDTIKMELASWPEKVVKGPKGEKFIKLSEADISSAVCAEAIELCHVWAAHISLVLREKAE